MTKQAGLYMKKGRDLVRGDVVQKDDGAWVTLKVVKNGMLKYHQFISWGNSEGDWGHVHNHDVIECRRPGSEGQSKS